MKSLASVTDNDIETIKMALNDSISDMISELKNKLSPEQNNALINYKEKYLRVFEKLKTNGSMYALTETDLDIVASGLNDAIELIEDNLKEDDLNEEDSEEILKYKNDCQRLVDLLAS
jgi:rRNA maturation endonuclease Nob1